MPSNYQSFWKHDRYAVVGHSAKANFPMLTYRGLKELGKTVFAVDPSVKQIDGDTAFADLCPLPEPVDAVILEVPKQETKGWVARAADAGVHDVWIHMGRETPEAIALAKERGINLRSGSCAVMYVTPGPTYHSVHKWINKLIGKY